MAAMVARQMRDSRDSNKQKERNSDLFMINLFNCRITSRISTQAKRRRMVRSSLEQHTLVSRY